MPANPSAEGASPRAKAKRARDLTRPAGVEPAQSERVLDGDEVDVGVAEQQRLPDELHRLRLEQELAHRARWAAAADDEERAERPRLELRGRARVAQRDPEPLGEVVG